MPYFVFPITFKRQNGPTSDVNRPRPVVKVVMYSLRVRLFWGSFRNLQLLSLLGYHFITKEKRNFFDSIRKIIVKKFL